MLRRRDSGESDRRLTLFTAGQGKIDVLAKGARKGGSRLAGSSEPLVYAQFHLACGKKQRYVTQVQPRSSYPSLRTDFERLSLGLMFMEILEKLLPYEQPRPEIFESSIFALDLLSSHERPKVASIWAQLKLLFLEGVMPSWTRCVITGQQLAENPASISPGAGGYVCAEHAAGYHDRFPVRCEVLIALEKTSHLETAPPRLKDALECLRVLSVFWLYHLGVSLPACDAVLESAVL